MRPLIKALDDTGPGVACAAIYALGELGSLKAVAPVSRKLSDADEHIRRAAAFALAKFGDNRAVDVLIDDGLAYYESSIREQAALWLGRLGDKKAIAPLKKALADFDNKVRMQAAQALHSLGETQWADIVKGNREDYDRLAGAGDDIVLEAIVKKISNDDVKTALKNHAGKKVVPMLLQVISEHKNRTAYQRYDETWINAIEVLGAIGDKSAVAPLIDMLKTIGRNYYDAVKTAIVQALVSINDQSAAAPLIDALDNDSGDYRITVAEALCRLGAPEWKDIIKGDEEDFVRLSEAGHVMGIDVLKAMLGRWQSHWQQRRSAAKALISIARQNRDIDILNDDTKTIMRKAHADGKAHADNGQAGKDCVL